MGLKLFLYISSAHFQSALSKTSATLLPIKYSKIVITGESHADLGAGETMKSF
jgi:hypothetical protein